MTASCPFCATHLDLPHDGRFQCGRCGKAFQYLRFRRSEEQPALPTWSPDAPEGSRCAGHPNNAAVKLCERCGDFSCELCSVPVEGRVYCARCFGLLCERGAFRFAQHGFQAPKLASSLGALAWLGLFVPGLGLVAGGMGIVVALGALKKIHEQPDLPGRGAAIGAIVNGGVCILLNLGAGGWILWEMLKPR